MDVVILVLSNYCLKTTPLEDIKKLTTHWTNRNMEVIERREHYEQEQAYPKGQQMCGIVYLLAIFLLK